MRVCVGCDFENTNLIISFSLFEKELGKPHIGIYPKKSFLPMTVNKIDSLPPNIASCLCIAIATSLVDVITAVY